MRLCGISSRFQLLSPCTGQVTHALLTRPPLSIQSLHPEGIRLSIFVRLACVRHAASVHPEPGSNSHVKVFSFAFYRRNVVSSYSKTRFAIAGISVLLSRTRSVLVTYDVVFLMHLCISKTSYVGFASIQSMF